MCFDIKILALLINYHLSHSVFFWLYLPGGADPPEVGGGPTGSGTAIAGLKMLVGVPVLSKVGGGGCGCCGCCPYPPPIIIGSCGVKYG